MRGRGVIAVPGPLELNRVILWERFYVRVLEEIDRAGFIKEMRKPLKRNTIDVRAEGRLEEGRYVRSGRLRVPPDDDSHHYYRVEVVGVAE